MIALACLRASDPNELMYVSPQPSAVVSCRGPQLREHATLHTAQVAVVTQIAHDNQTALERSFSVWVFLSSLNFHFLHLYDCFQCGFVEIIKHERCPATWPYLAKYIMLDCFPR